MTEDHIGVAVITKKVMEGESVSEVGFDGKGIYKRTDGSNGWELFAAGMLFMSAVENTEGDVDKQKSLRSFFRTCFLAGATCERVPDVFDTEDFDKAVDESARIIGRIFGTDFHTIESDGEDELSALRRENENLRYALSKMGVQNA